MEERKKEEKSGRSKDINFKRKEEPSENKPKDLHKNKERKRSNFDHPIDFKYLLKFICCATIIISSYEIITIKYI